MVSEPGSLELGSKLPQAHAPSHGRLKQRRSSLVQPAVLHLQEEDELAHGVQKLLSVHPHSLLSLMKEDPWRQRVLKRLGIPLQTGAQVISFTVQERKVIAFNLDLVWRLKHGGKVVSLAWRGQGEATQRRRGWFPNQQLRSVH